MKKYAHDSTKDNYAFGLFVWQVAKDGQVPYDGLEEDKVHRVKNSDKELSTLLEEMPEGAPECFRDVIVTMTKYAPMDRADLTSVGEMLGLDENSDMR